MGTILKNICKPLLVLPVPVLLLLPRIDAAFSATMPRKALAEPLLLLFLGWVLSRLVPWWRKASYAPSAVAGATLLLLFWMISAIYRFHPDLSQREQSLRVQSIWRRLSSVALFALVAGRRKSGLCALFFEHGRGTRVALRVACYAFVLYLYARRSARFRPDARCSRVRFVPPRPGLRAEVADAASG